ncbi:MAG: matrixin family metalloprotease [Patescibacteria group bacterium]
MLKNLKPVFAYLLPVLVVGLVAQAALKTDDLSTLNPFYKPCAEPLAYATERYDERFGVSEEEFAAAVTEAAALWNDAAGTEVLAVSSEPSITVGMLYDERQRAVELGETIGGEQSAYDSMKREVEKLNDRFVSLRTSHEAKTASFERDVRKYEEDVQMWNARGGAPPAVYEELEAKKRELERRKKTLDAEVATLNSLIVSIQERVTELNLLAKQTNEKVNTYNKTLGHDFDQGNYVEDEAGRRITIFTFQDRSELKRVLAHEFGHALGIGHLTDAGAIMYSYNIGNELILTLGDVAALKEVCKLK